MRRLLLASLCLTAAMLLVPGNAGASHDPSGEPFDEDFVVGRATHLFILPHSLSIESDAHSGPLGENATGTAFARGHFTELGGPVTCLTVADNRAVVGGMNVSVAPGRGYLFEIEDNAATGTPDRLGSASDPVGLPEIPAQCPAPDDLDVPLWEADAGDLVVHDAVPPVPTTKEQCKDGGWRDFPQFENQGQCIKTVQHGG